MLVVGSRGFAKQILHSLSEEMLTNLAFFDNVNTENSLLFDRFPILHTEKEVSHYFSSTDRSFTLGLAGSALRIKFTDLMTGLGGHLASTISVKADISPYGTHIAEGVNILSGVTIEPGAIIEKGCLININASVTHDTYIGAYTEICPDVNLLGGCIIGEECFLGAGAIILPKVKIGKKVRVGAGAVVTRDVSDNQTVIGIPAK